MARGYSNGAHDKPQLLPALAPLLLLPLLCLLPAALLLLSTLPCRSGAYNRTLTPFGFQAEERTYWEVRLACGSMSWMVADWLVGGCA